MEEKVTRRKFALVRWTKGEDKGTLSEIKTEAIRQYDDSKMDEEGNPINKYHANIEWRQGRKTKDGWPMYEGHIIYVANNRFEISKKMRELAPPKPLIPQKRKHIPPKRFEDEESDSSTDIEQSQTLKITSGTQMSKAQSLLAKYRSAGLNNRMQSEEDRMEKLVEENIKLKKENQHLKDMLIKEIPGLLHAVQERTRETGSSRELSSDSATSPVPQTLPAPMAHTSAESSNKTFSDKIEIYTGTQVFCDKLAWSAAVNATSLSVFVRTVLMSVFPIDVLLKSNLRGKNQEGRNGRAALDASKVDAIYRAALTKWPHATHSQIGMVINSKLNELRRKRHGENKKQEENKQTGETLMLFDD